MGFCEGCGIEVKVDLDNKIVCFVSKYSLLRFAIVMINNINIGSILVDMTWRGRSKPHGVNVSLISLAVNKSIEWVWYVTSSEVGCTQQRWWSVCMISKWEESIHVAKQSDKVACFFFRHCDQTHDHLWWVLANPMTSHQITSFEFYYPTFQMCLWSIPLEFLQCSFFKRFFSFCPHLSAIPQLDSHVNTIRTI